MLTLFTTAKPFRGHTAIIQRNALMSWKRLHPEAEIFVFGDDEGAAETCRELGLTHIARVERNEHGTKYLRSIWEPAQEIARHEIVCYSNCDIILTREFARAVERLRAWDRKFLMIGRRWDTDIREAIDFERANWEEDVMARAREANQQRGPEWIDYFVFRRGLYRGLPGFVIGRVGWDNWLVWKARQEGAAVVDASPSVRAIHQNHDYAYHPEGYQGVWHGAEAQQNYALYESWRCLNTIEDADWVLEDERLRRTRRRIVTQARRELARLRSRAWHGVLRATRPVRHRLGLRQENLRRLMGREAR